MTVFSSGVRRMNIMFPIPVQNLFYILMAMEIAQQYPEQGPGPGAVLLQITRLNHQVTESGSLFMVTHPSWAEMMPAWNKKRKAFRLCACSSMRSQ